MIKPPLAGTHRLFHSLVGLAYIGKGTLEALGGQTLGIVEIAIGCGYLFVAVQGCGRKSLGEGS